MVKLIADGGSTKTNWMLIDAKGRCIPILTQGMNPYFQNDETIQRVLRMELIYPMRQEGVQPDDVTHVHYYGAGVRDSQAERFSALLHSAFPNALLGVASDLLAAARALFGSSPGIACILGTGSNSGLYDGKTITANVPPLGYILGDEGSGAVLGKRFIGALFKGMLPENLKEEYLSDTGQELADVIDKVYRQPMPNRYLAAAAKFIKHHLDCEPLRLLVVDHFREFFRRNTALYQRPDLPLGAVGGIACHFQDLLAEAAALEGATITKVMERPIEPLATFHQHYPQTL